MNETEHLNIPIPNPAAEPPTHVNAEFERLRLAWQMVDLILYNLQIALANKSNVDHTQAMETVVGLVDALANKMAADRTFKLDDLTDVAGADEAAVNYVLVKTPAGWVPSTAIAALGLHNHLINEVSGLVEALLAKADASSVYTKSQVDTAIAAGVVPIGTSIAFNGTTVPTGFLKENGAAYSRTTYAALFAVIGTTHGIGDGSTTFNVPDSRGEFIRGLDDGRGVDVGRTLGSAQASQNLAHVHGITDPGHQHTVSWNVGPGGPTFDQNITNVQVASNSGPTVRSTSAAATGITINSSGGTEARPRNVAKLLLIRAY